MDRVVKQLKRNGLKDKSKMNEDIKLKRSETAFCLAPFNVVI